MWVKQDSRFFVFKKALKLRDNKIKLKLLSLRKTDFDGMERLIKDVNVSSKLNASISFEKEALVG